MMGRRFLPLERLRRKSLSLWGKVAILLAIFIACPAMIYLQLRDADAEKNALILQSVQNQGRLISMNLAPLLLSSGTAGAPEIQKELQRLPTGPIRVKVLFRRADDARSDSYLYIASLPPSPGAYLTLEYKEIIRRRILDRLGDTCAGYNALAIHFINPAGETELLSSMTPVHTNAGCWVILTSYPPEGFSGVPLGQPYWKRTEVQIAAAIYVAMAVLTFFLFMSIWRSLQRFGTLARKIQANPGKAGSFREQNRVPELDDVAQEFDLMVGSLSKSEAALQEAAEENAHAFKTPIAVIAQSVEPLKRSVGSDDTAANRAIELIERSVQRLDTLVGAARRMDHTLASLVHPPRERIDLSHLLNRMLEAYGETASMQKIRLSLDIASDCYVRAGEDLLETVFENILDNALDHSPPGSVITTTLRKVGTIAEVTITDQGGGVDSRNLNRIFDRYFSDRPHRDADNDVSHYGIGLWIARRNIEAVGGNISASNAPQQGLAVKVRLPLDR
ncbi:MAG: HAMP domain-containing sensor histidine kinase [Alphaproteobacteria bacterium]|nr:HAMP domain-containing sensor histidine kinase [Alphaproteobacteria bacterium]